MTYSFSQYNIDTKFTRENENNKHNTVGYALLGLIGELGEVVENLNYDNVSGGENLLKTKDDLDVKYILEDFVHLAKQVESLKKRIRKEQIPVIQGATIDNLIEELGGVYWYLNNLAGLSDLDMGEVAEANKDMLQNRFNKNPGWMTNGGIKTH